jgi:hypothetical protein
MPVKIAGIRVTPKRARAHGVEPVFAVAAAGSAMGVMEQSATRIVMFVQHDVNLAREI